MSGQAVSWIRGPVEAFGLAAQESNPVHGGVVSSTLGALDTNAGPIDLLTARTVLSNRWSSCSKYVLTSLLTRGCLRSHFLWCAIQGLTGRGREVLKNELLIRTFSHFLWLELVNLSKPILKFGTTATFKWKVHSQTLKLLI